MIFSDRSIVSVMLRVFPFIPLTWMKNYSNRGDFLMKAQKKSDTNMSLREKKEITQKNIRTELSGHKNAVSNKIFYLLTFVSLGLPNLVFSGLGWFDTLHIMKWSSAMVPIALISMIGGLSLALYGNELTDFKIEPIMFRHLCNLTCKSFSKTKTKAKIKSYFQSWLRIRKSESD